MGRWAAFVCVAVIFGVAYSFAAFFRSFGAEFAADRADVSLVFGLSGLIYFLLGAGAGMLADRFGPRARLRGGDGRHRRRPAGEQLRAVDGGDLRRLGRRPGHRHRPRLRAVDRQRAAVVRAPARLRRRHRQRRHRRRHARRAAARDGGDRRARLAPRAAGDRRGGARRRRRRDAAAAPRADARRRRHGSGTA